MSPPGSSSALVSDSSFVPLRFALRVNKREALLVRVLYSCSCILVLFFGAGSGLTCFSLFRIEDVLSGISCRPRSFTGDVNIDLDILRRFGGYCDSGLTVCMISKQPARNWWGCSVGNEAVEMWMQRC